MNITYQTITDYLQKYKTNIKTKATEYKNVRQKLILVCSSCQQDYQCSFFDFKRKENKVCLLCSKKHSGEKKIIYFDLELIEKEFSDITIISEKKSYQRKEKISCQCKNCNHVFDEAYYILLRKKNKQLLSCSHCNRENKKIRDRQQTYQKTIEFCQNNNLNFVSSEEEFINGKEIFVCPKCNQTFHRPHKYFNREIYPNRTELCQNCSNSNPISNEELKIRMILEKHNIDFESNNREILNGKELDIYIPDHQIAIEINGLYYHSELKGIDKQYHLHKTLECERQGIQLLQFWDYEVNNKLEIVEDIIKSKLNLLQKKIGARELKIELVDSKRAKEFMNTNHLHGFCQAKWHIALVKNNLIYSIVSLGKSRTSDHWEIIRFASLNNTKVVGGYSRLISHIKNELHIENLMSFADRRVSNGDLYLKSGWKFDSVSSPCYWYFKNKQIYHRSNFMKYKLKNMNGFDHALTEWENMIKMGYDRVWDCGNLKFIF